MIREFLPFHLDDVDQSLWRDGQRIRLTPKAYALLHYLVMHAGRLTTQEELLEALWPDTFVQPEVLKSQILDVRAALGDRPRDPLFIETVPRRGYRFIAAVREMGAAPVAPAEPRPAPTAAPPLPMPRRTIVGRRQALETLRASVRSASAGDRQVVFVTGEQGIGKSTTVDAFLSELAPADAIVIRGQSLESFGAAKEPYYPILDALDQLARTHPDLLGARLRTHAPAWLARFPALVQPGDRDDLHAAVIGATPGRLVREMCELLERLAEATLLVVVFEDLHWCDHATVDVLVALARRRMSARLLLIGTYRPVDVVLAQHPLKAACHSLKVSRLAHDIPLLPLDDGDVAEYLSGPAGSRAPEIAELAHWVRRQTDGNPLFMVTMIEHLLARGDIVRDASHAWTIATPLDRIGTTVPDTLRELIELQIERLPETEQLVLDAASVHGITFSATVTATVLDLDADEVEDVCFELARTNHIIRGTDAARADGLVAHRFEFVHAAFRHVLYQRLAPSRRLKLHRRFGDAIERLAGDERASHAVELAGHFERCGDWPRAVDYLRLAARNAWQRFDYREAVTTLEHALDAASHLAPVERAPLEVATLWMLAVVLQALHDAPRVMPTLTTLVQKAAGAGLVESQIRALLALVFFRSRDDATACRQWLEQAEPLIADLASEPARHELAQVACVARIVLFGWDAAIVERHDRALVEVERVCDRIAVAAAHQSASMVRLLTSKYNDSLRNAEDSLQPLLESGRLVLYYQGREMVATNLRLLGRWGESLDLLDDAIESARKNESDFRLAMALVVKAHVHLEAMDFSGVLDMCRQAAPWLDGSLIRDRQYISRQLAAAAALGLGQTDHALSNLLETRQAMQDRPVALSWLWQLPLHISLCDAWLAKGNGDQARIEADVALSLAAGIAERTWLARAWDASARVAFAQTDQQRAEQDVARGLAAIDGCHAPLAAWRLHATAAAIGGRDRSRAVDHRRAGQQVVSALAGSLSSRPALREIFLASPLVRPLAPA